MQSDIETTRAQTHTTSSTTIQTALTAQTHTHPYNTRSKTYLDQSKQRKQTTLSGPTSHFNLCGLGSAVASAWENFAGSSDEDEDTNKKLLKSETIPETSNQAGKTSKPFLHEFESL